MVVSILMQNWGVCGVDGSHGKEEYVWKMEYSPEKQKSSNRKRRDSQTSFRSLPTDEHGGLSKVQMSCRNECFCTV